MNNKSTHQQFKSQDRDKKKYTIGGGIVVLLIAISPYLFYLYESFPTDSNVWETFLFKIETNYQSIYLFAWFLTGKLIPLYLLFIWFFTCKHWWHWIILIPITMYLFQTWGLINQSMQLDEVELLYMIPVMLVIIPAVYLIRAKVFNRVRGDDMKAFEEELKTKRTLWDELKDLFR
ncbi:hypothetical protein [Planktosalinus lacus]|uniref:Uncharacterized protein n=1 Tax=Planktosalinus lacus TaxID=1526573 RepID=A0A8J2YB90_9FLAO|nr:hypothetical protein [Planktosalinus lacus]GGD94341.1 hypothetical protein GCM10011312_17600 [Planktosalinus lacus]